VNTLGFTWDIGCRILIACAMAANEEFDQLCFDFGIELDEDVRIASFGSFHFLFNRCA
jgi:hypothetical protein